jgi:hypothetical protein
VPVKIKTLQHGDVSEHEEQHAKLRATRMTRNNTDDTDAGRF